MQIDEGGGVTIPVTIGGQDLRMLIDAAGMFSLMNRLLSLTTSSERSASVGGRRISPNWPTRRTGELRLDDWALRSFCTEVLLIFGAAAKDALCRNGRNDCNRPYPQLRNGIFEFANEKFNIFLQKHCWGKVAYWVDEGVTP